MTIQDLYIYTTIASGAVALTLAAILAGFRIRPGKGLEQYNRARKCLAAAFGIYGILSLAELSVTGTAGIETGDLTPPMVLFIGSLMAMFSTTMVLSFIRPELAQFRHIMTQLIIIVPLGILLILAKIFMPQAIFRVVFALMLAAYLALLFFYTRLFLKSYHHFTNQLLDFYEEEDLAGQLQWINRSFYLTLSIGIAALFLLLNNLLITSLITILFTICFLFICVFFVNYHPYAAMVTRAVDKQGTKPVGTQETETDVPDSDLKDKLDAWVAGKGYLDNTKSVEDVAYDMGILWYPHLKEYIQKTTGEDFRSWRVRLRIQEAERILAEQPDLPVTKVVTAAGFNDRAFFYRSFKKVTGLSVKEFLETHR